MVSLIHFVPATDKLKDVSLNDKCMRQCSALHFKDVDILVDLQKI